MTDAKLIEAIAREIAACEPRSFRGDAIAVIAAIEGLGYRIVPVDALKRWEARIKEAEARVKKLEDLIRVLVDNDPNDTISDSGHTVLDLWRHDARTAISPYALKEDTE